MVDQENSPLPGSAAEPLSFSDSRVPSPHKSKPVAILQESKNNNDNFQLKAQPVAQGYATQSAQIGSSAHDPMDPFQDEKTLCD